jgi:hypothetical protein
MNYSTLSLSELKALAIENNAIPTGDKRSKQSWIDALELAASLETIQEIEPAETIDIAVDIWTIDPTTNSEPTPANPLLGGAIESEIHIGVGHTKKGAATIVALLLCVIILALQATISLGCAIAKTLVYLAATFQQDDPWHQITNLLIRPKHFAFAT